MPTITGTPSADSLVGTDGGVVTRITTDASGAQANNLSSEGALSPDESLVVFGSWATNLVPGDVNGQFDVFVKNLASGAVTLVSTSSTGVSGDAISGGPYSFSPDNAKLAFESAATNLVAGDTNGVFDVFIKDLTTGATTLLSINALGVEGNGRSLAPVFSPDGTKLAFISAASNLVAGDTNQAQDVFIKDLVTGAVTRVSTDASGHQVNGNASSVLFSPDGSKVAITTAADMVPGDINGGSDVYLKDLVTGAVTRVSTDPAGTAGNGVGGAFATAFSPDGSKVLFFSANSDLVPNDTNGSLDVFIKDLTTGVITRVSTDASGAQGNGQSVRGFFSPDGKEVMFSTSAANIAPGASDANSQVVLKDLATGAITLVSTNVSGTIGNSGTGADQFSPGGGQVLIESAASNFVPGDTNGANDLFLKTLGGGDTLIGGAGDDTLDGKGGIDTAAYSGALADYLISTTGSGVTTVQDLRSGSPDGTDTLTNIERLQFSDQTITLVVGNHAPVAAPDSATTGFGAPVVISAAALLANDSDTDSDALSVIAVGGASNGSVSLSGGNVTFTPASGFSGSAGFDYTISDGHGGTAVGAVAVEVGGPAVTLAASSPSTALVEAGVGQPGVAGSNVTLTRGGGVATVSFVLTGWTSLGGSLYGETGTYGAAVLDTAANTLTYTLNDLNPATNALAGGQAVSDVITVSASDGTSSASQPIAFQITGTNDSPVAGADTFTTAYATAITISAASLLANDSDPEGDTLTVAAVAAAAHGTVSLSGGNVTFNPFVGYLGPDAFNYRITDGHGGSTTGHVALTVTGTSPAYIYRAGVTAAETIDTRGDTASHNVVTGSGNDMVFTGAGGSNVNLGSGNDAVIGGTGKDIVTFGAGLDTVTGGAGPDVFIFIKGQIADPTAHGGAYDTVTDFAGAGSAYVTGRDFIYLKGFATTATITYEHDLSGDPTAHLYRVDDGAYHAEFVLDYAGAGVALSHSQYSFL